MERRSRLTICDCTICSICMKCVEGGFTGHAYGHFTVKRKREKDVEKETCVSNDRSTKLVYGYGIHSPVYIGCSSTHSNT